MQTDRHDHSTGFRILLVVIRGGLDGGEIHRHTFIGRWSQQPNNPLLRSVDRHSILEKRSGGFSDTTKSMNNEATTRTVIDSIVQETFDLIYEDDEGDGEVDAADVVGAIKNAYPAQTAMRMLELTGTESVREMVLMYLDGRTQAKR